MCTRSPYKVDVEPGVYLADQPYCQGAAVVLKSGDKVSNTTTGWISSVLAPPHVNVELRNMPEGTYPYVKTTLEPGIHNGLGWRPTQACDDKSCNDYNPLAWDNIALSVYANRAQSWPDFVTDCCSKNKSKEICQELYGPNSGNGQCNPSMMKYCSRNPENAHSSICQEWYLENPTFKTQIAEMVCSNPANIENNKCKDWCRQNSGKCDIAASEFCEKNPEDPFCTCLTSPVTKYNPACVDAQCIGSGYINASMKTMPCPNIVDCSTQIELQTGGRTTTGDITAVQNCGMDGETPVPTPTTGPNYMLILLFVFILIVIIAGTFVVYRRTANREKT